MGFTLIGNQIRPKPFDLSSLFHSVVLLAMEVQIPIHTVFDVPSLLQAVAADTVLAAAQSIALIGYLLTNGTNSVSPNLTAANGRFPLEDLFGRKHAYLENKNSETEDDDKDGDEDDEDGHDQDDDGEDEEFSGEEGDEEGDPEDDPEANGGGSDDDDDDNDNEEDDDDGEDEEEEEDEEEDEEETSQPPTKKRK